MRFCTCLPLCPGSPPTDDSESPPRDLLENKTTLESLRPEPIVSLTTKNAGLISGEDEFGIGGVASAKGNIKSGLVTADGMGVTGNVSLDHGVHKVNEYRGRGKECGDGGHGGRDGLDVNGGFGDENGSSGKTVPKREGTDITSQREHQINMEQIINCGEDPEAENHLKIIHRHQIWKKPFRSLSLPNLVSLRWKAKRPEERERGYRTEVERFSIEDGRISREMTELD
jgi:hypothetical protein